MALLINDVRTHHLQKGARYLFDANVWLAVLDINFSSYIMEPYVDLFNTIVEKNAAKIVLPSLLLSEVLNRYLNDIYYKEFCRVKPQSGMGKAAHYKNIYRPSKQYEIDLVMATSEIKSYAASVALLSDQFDTFTLNEVLTDIPLTLDFNDHLYIQIAKKQNAIIVTNDKDFRTEDVPILTSNPGLLKGKK